MLTDEYIAGFFDGEGSISINAGGRSSVAITQKNPSVLYLIQSRFGGNVYQKTKKFNECFHWRISGKEEVIRFLEKMLPICVCKKQEIELGLEAAKLVRTNNNGCCPLTSEEHAQRLSIRARMQELRPKKNFCNLSAQEFLYRQKIKEDANWLCNKCGKDLQDTRVRDQVVSEDKLWCRACAANRTNHKPLKPISKEQIVEALETYNNLEEVCKFLDIGRSALFKKRKEYGLPPRIALRGKKRGTYIS
jgi:hypothetical protein